MSGSDLMSQPFTFLPLAFAITSTVRRTTPPSSSGGTELSRRVLLSL